LKYIRKYKVTGMLDAPAMFSFISQHPDSDDADLSNIKILVCGAALVAKSLLALYAKPEIN
jgi:fatty-acyl-CoA synthase